MTVADLMCVLAAMPQDMEVRMDTLHYGEPKSAEIGVEAAQIDRFDAFTYRSSEAERTVVRIFDAS